MFHIVGQLISGFVVGMIAQLILIGNDPGGLSIRGLLFTAFIGMAGSFVGTLGGKLIFGKEKYAAGWIMSIAGAVLLLILFRMVF